MQNFKYFSNNLVLKNLILSGPLFRTGEKQPNRKNRNYRPQIRDMLFWKKKDYPVKSSSPVEAGWPELINLSFSRLI